jgi:hypothetical protein
VGDVSSDSQSFLSFLEAQRPRHEARFPALKVDKILAFMGTTSLAGSYASCSVHALRGIERASAASELRVFLSGTLPRPPAVSECVTVHMTRVERYQGFQVKTRALVPGVAEAELLESEGGRLTVRGAQIFTVHHSPYTLQFYESIPFEDVAATVTGLPHALVAVGASANLSPRFVFHHEVRDGKVLLFHGDGLALKTYMNVRRNPCETRLVLDLDTGAGFALTGQVEEFQPPQHEEAYERICRGFQAGGWGKPSRVFRFTPEKYEEIGPR